MDATTVSTTPASPAPTAPAAPATSAPASAPTPSQRPTFAQAFAPDATPTSVSPAASEGTATTEPAATTTPESALHPSEPKGPIPFDVHKTALDNGIQKGEQRGYQRAQEEFQAKVGASFQEIAPLAQMYVSDRPRFVQHVVAEALADPNLAPMMRSEAARALASGRQSQQSPQPAQTVPDVPILNEQGQVVGNLRDIVQQHLAEYAAKEIAPLKSDLEQRKAEADARHAQQELQTQVQDIYSEAVDLLPGFKEHEADIAKVFATIPGDPAKAMRAAWKQVVGSTLANRDQVRTEQLDELKTKHAAAVGSVNPAQTAVTATSRPKSFLDPNLKW